MKRRPFLGTLATAGVLGVAGCAGRGGIAGLRTNTTADATDVPRNAESTARDDYADFVWAEQSLWTHDRVRENLFAFAARNDCAVVVAKADAGVADVPQLETVLDAAARHGVEAWLNVGVLKSIAAPAFVDDDRRRRTFLDGLGAVVAAYRDVFPAGKIVLWQEAPVGGRWVESGAWNDQAVANLERLGPEIFAAEKERVKRIAPDVDVGIFVHFPYLVDGKQPETFATLTDDLRARGALPDFTFTDFYRGWYEKDVGPGPANATVRSLVSNAGEHTDGRPVTYLGEAHTIDPNYTPSKQAMWMDLRAALGAGADAMGWYARTGYTPTERDFDPFVPNTGPAPRDGPLASTFTFARDRYEYAYAALRAEREEKGTFDLWVSGTGVDFYDHRLSARTRSGEWAFVGGLGSYFDGNYPYSTEGHHVSVIRGLSRERFWRCGRLELRVETDPGVHGARLATVRAMPTNVACFRTEAEATALDEGRTDLAAFDLGHARVDASLVAGSTRRVEVPLTGAKRPLGELVFPGSESQRARLRRLEARDGFDFEDVFDCWVAGGANHRTGGRFVGLSLVGDAGEHTLQAVSTAVSVADGGAVFYGIDRRHLDHDGDSVGINLAGADGAVERVYAMPYAGTVAYRDGETAMTLLDADPESARTFSIAHDG